MRVCKNVFLKVSLINNKISSKEHWNNWNKFVQLSGKVTLLVLNLNTISLPSMATLRRMDHKHNI